MDHLVYNRDLAYLKNLEDQGNLEDLAKSCVMEYTQTSHVSKELALTIPSS